MLQLIPKPNKVIIQKDILKQDVDVIKQVSDKYGQEGYKLTVKADGIYEEGSEKGLFYADVTLRQLKEQYGENIPLITIEDKPRFSYRGFMLDVCRHFISVEQIKLLLHTAAYFKLNKFHWHLTDDQGWRIEIKKYPKLVEIGSIRKRANFGRLYEPEKSGGFYTQDEIKDIILYAQNLMIDVIPEIEIPGHATALLASYPELGCMEEKIEVATRGGILPNLICAGKEQSWKFVRDVLDEVADLFPYPYIHIGGDEACKVKWRKCPACQNKIKEYNLKDENALQQWFTIRIQKHLSKKGKTTVVWNDSLRGNPLSTEFVVQSWMGDEELIVDFAKRGGKIIQSNTKCYYLDYPYHMIDVDKIIETDPLFNFENMENDLNDIDWNQAVIGIEAPLWTERVTNFDRASYLLFPRLPAVAENAWTDKEETDPDHFMERYKAMISHLERAGIYGAPEYCWKMSKEDAEMDERDYKYLSESTENLRALKDDNEMMRLEDAIYNPHRNDL